MKRLTLTLCLTLCATMAVADEAQQGILAPPIETTNENLPIDNKTEQEATANATKGDEAQNIIESSAYGTSAVKESTAEFIDNNQRIDYTREIMHNFYIQATKVKLRPETSATKGEMVKIVVNANNNANSKDNSKNEVPTTTVKGFCLIKEDVNIGKQPGSLGIDCQTNIGYVTMFANLRAENKIATLFVDPVYIEFKNYRYQIKSSYVTNEAKTSYNIATFVNDRKVTEVALTATSDGLDEIKTASNQYLQAYEQSRRYQSTQVYSTGLTSYPLQSTNYLEPDPLLYLAKSGINILASSGKALASAIKKDLPYLYQIVGGTKIYVDMQVVTQGQKVANR